MFTVRFAKLDTVRIVSLPPDTDIQKLLSNGNRCQAKFLTSHYVHMHRVIFYIPNTLIKLIFWA